MTWSVAEYSLSSSESLEPNSNLSAYGPHTLACSYIRQQQLAHHPLQRYPDPATDLQSLLHQLISHPGQEGVGHTSFKGVLTHTYKCEHTNCCHMEEIATILIAMERGLVTQNTCLYVCVPDLRAVFSLSLKDALTEGLKVSAHLCVVA